MQDLAWEFETLAIRAGHERTNENEHSEALFPTSSFVFKNAAEAAARSPPACTGGGWLSSAGLWIGDC